MSITRDRQRAQLLRDSEFKNGGQSAIIATTPVSSSDELYVTLPLSDYPEQREGPVLWSPKPGPTYPQRDDKAVVVQDDSGQYWLVEWKSSIPDMATQVELDAVIADSALLDTRLDVIEARRQVFNFAGASTLDLGPYDGDNILGVKIIMFGMIEHPGADSAVWIQPSNIVASINTAWVRHRSWKPSTAGAPVTDVQAGNAALRPGLLVGQSDFMVAGRESLFSAEGIYYTRTLPTVGGSVPLKSYLGRYGNVDRTADGNSMMNVSVWSLDHSNTAVTAIDLFLDNGGTFTGRVITEVI